MEQVAEAAPVRRHRPEAGTVVMTIGGDGGTNGMVLVAMILKLGYELGWLDVASRVSSSITIGRTIEDVFAVLTNVENTESWFPAKVKEWWTSEPPRGVGSTRHAVVAMGWFRTENDAVATVYEWPRRAVMKGTSSNAPFETTLTFAPVEGGTRVEATTDIFLRGPAKLFGPPFTRWYSGNWDRGLVKLKTMMESGQL
jgi:carbon monoxide dehydrogenase subunit G